MENLIGLPDLKVNLEGSFAAPVVVNNSGRTLIGYVLHVEDDSGMDTNIPVYRLQGIKPGAQDVYVRVDDLEAARKANRQALPRHVHQDGTPVIVSKISIDSVIFDDGQVAGPDSTQFYRFAAAHFDAVREFALQALADMSKIERAVRAPIRERAQNVESFSIARELWSIQQGSGLEGARQEAFRMSQVPKLWKETAK